MPVATATQQLLIPEDGKDSVWTRFKCRRPDGHGKVRVTLGEAEAEHITVETTAWKWVQSNGNAIPRRSGKVNLQFMAAYIGVLVDQFLITDDTATLGILSQAPAES